MPSTLLTACRSQWVFTRLLCIEFKLEGCGPFNTSQQNSFLNQGSKLFSDNFNHHVQAGLLRGADGKGEAAQPPSSSPPRPYDMCLCHGSLLAMMSAKATHPFPFNPSYSLLPCILLHLRISKPFLTIKLLILMTVFLHSTDEGTGRAIGSTAHYGTCFSPSPSLLTATAARCYNATISSLLIPARCRAQAPVQVGKLHLCECCSKFTSRDSFFFTPSVYETPGLGNFSRKD